MSESPPLLHQRLRQIGAAVFLAGLGIYVGVQLVLAVWVWLVIGGAVAAVIVGLLMWYRRNRCW